MRAIAAGLLALGIRPEDRVAIAAGTRLEWILAAFGILCAGTATTTVYPTTPAADVAFILRDSGARVVFAEDDEQLAKLRAHRAELPDLVKAVTFDGTPDGDGRIPRLVDNLGDGRRRSQAADLRLVLRGGPSRRRAAPGPQLPGTQVRIAGDGEVLVRGPGVMRGYHSLPEETAATLDQDGWPHTGDVGPRVDRDHAQGGLRVRDRDRGLRRRSTLLHRAGGLGPGVDRWETIKRFAILPRGLTVEEGDLTPSLKLKRRVVVAKHRELLESLYDAGPPR